MKTTSFLPLHGSIKAVTILVTLGLVGALGYCGYNYWTNTETSESLIGIIVCVWVLVTSIALSPRKAIVTDNAIEIHMIASKLHIPAEEVEKIEHYPHGIDSHRMVGIGMFFGNIGWFHSSDCGKHLSLVTNPSDVCVITRKNKIPVVVSIQDPSVFTPICEVLEKH